MNKNIKALILDADGVVLINNKRFSQRYPEEYGLPSEVIQPFFENELQDCLLGKKDLREELVKILTTWQWNKSVDKLLNYWLSGETNLNEELLKYIKPFKEKGLKVYLGTNNEKYRTEYLWKTIGLKNHIHKAYASYAIGHKKPDPKFFGHILKDLKLPPNQILFIDDDPENVNAAKEAGMNTETYLDFRDFKKKLLKYL